MSLHKQTKYGAVAHGPLIEIVEHLWNLDRVITSQGVVDIIWKSFKIFPTSKINIYNSFVKSILLYGNYIFRLTDVKERH